MQTNLVTNSIRKIFQCKYSPLEICSEHWPVLLNIPLSHTITGEHQEGLSSHPVSCALRRISLPWNTGWRALPQPALHSVPGHIEGVFCSNTPCILRAKRCTIVSRGWILPITDLKHGAWTVTAEHYFSPHFTPPSIRGQLGAISPLSVSLILASVN